MSLIIKLQLDCALKGDDVYQKRGEEAQNRGNQFYKTSPTYGLRLVLMELMFKYFFLNIHFSSYIELVAVVYLLLQIILLIFIYFWQKK